MLKTKLKNKTGMRAVARRMRKAGGKLVFTNGCFDIIHAGHIELLKKARHLGDALVVAVNSDDSVKKIKSAGRPITPESERLEILAAITYVDHLILFDEADPLELIKAILPDILVKGGDWKKEDIIGAKEVLESGGKVSTIRYLSGHSTTEMINRIIERHTKKNK